MTCRIEGVGSRVEGTTLVFYRSQARPSFSLVLKQAEERDVKTRPAGGISGLAYLSVAVAMTRNEITSNHNSGFAQLGFSK
jgi:hypothetical protein